MLLPLLTLSSCGVDMRNWPYIDFYFDVDKISTLYIDYDCRRHESESGKYYTRDKEDIKETCDFFRGFHTNPETCTSDISSYTDRFCAYFVSANNEVYDFKVYCFYGPSYLVYNDEMRYFPADFLSAVVRYMENFSAYLIKIS